MNLSASSNSQTEECLREIMKAEGYAMDRTREYGETGVDILAKRGKEIWHIEVIGFKRSPPARSKDFFEVFFRAISRLEDGAKHCVIALPRRFALGLPSRARHYGVAWKRIGRSFPELEIWLVDTANRTYERRTWNEWVE